MSWNYRIIRYANGDLGLHEVHYDDDGKPEQRTTEPAGFVASAGEGVDGIDDALSAALEDIATHPVLDDPWPDA